MDIALTTTWNPRGELSRFKRLLPELLERYSSISVVLPPAEMVNEAEYSAAEEVKRISDLKVFQMRDWSEGRHAALSHALEIPADCIQYTDMDRLLRWAETHPEELQIIAARIARTDCLIVGRTAQAYATHPQALVQTERISNMIVSHILGKQMDVSAGCKGFSRRAAEFLAANAIPGRALGTDAEWPILLHHAGFRIDYIEVDGLDWESADRYQTSAVDEDVQRRLAREYDAEPLHWTYRIEVAREIIQVALEVRSRSMEDQPCKKK